MSYLSCEFRSEHNNFLLLIDNLELENTRYYLGGIISALLVVTEILIFVTGLARFR